uniref:Mitogen-activated protein kinase kinase 5-like isoform X4 n=1 Tax=Rhizophora mucronata TaxID=61149 RepID=A0A2P2N4H9_RHIMU
MDRMSCIIRLYREQ